MKGCAKCELAAICLVDKGRIQEIFLCKRCHRAYTTVQKPDDEFVAEWSYGDPRDGTPIMQGHLQWLRRVPPCCNVATMRKEKCWQCRVHEDNNRDRERKWQQQRWRSEIKKLKR